MSGLAEGIAKLCYNISMAHQYSSLEEKLKDYTVNGECWEYNGCTDDCGYALFMVDHKLKYAHRWSYEFYHGEIPDNMTVDHICFNRKCIRPDHLRLLSRSENAKRHAKPLRKEFCSTCGGRKRLSKSGKTWKCPACSRRWSLNYKRRKKNARLTER